MQKRAPAPRGRWQAWLQDDDEEVSSWWQFHNVIDKWGFLTINGEQDSCWWQCQVLTKVSVYLKMKDTLVKLCVNKDPLPYLIKFISWSLILNENKCNYHSMKREKYWLTKKRLSLKFWLLAKNKETGRSRVCGHQLLTADWETQTSWQWQLLRYTQVNW